MFIAFCSWFGMEARLSCDRTTVPREIDVGPLVPIAFLTTRTFTPLTTPSYIITRNTCMQQPLALNCIQGTILSEHEVFRVHDFEIVFILYTFNIFQKM